jgi:hypothetical protein
MKECAQLVYFCESCTVLTQLCAYSYTGNTSCDAGRAADGGEAKADNGDAH